MPLTQVSGGGLADNSVNAAKIATGAVTVADIPDGEITHVKLAADCVDGDNIADNSINSEHYVDGSIDHAHLSDDCVDGDNIAADVALTGNPTATTQTAGNDTTRIATTAFVQAAVGSLSQDSMTEGNTKAEVVDTGSDGHFKVETEGSERLRIIADGKVGIGTNSPAYTLDVVGTDAVKLPIGTTNQRPGSLDANDEGILRFNSAQGAFEYWSNTSDTPQWLLVSSAPVQEVAVKYLIVGGGGAGGGHQAGGNWYDSGGGGGGGGFRTNFGSGNISGRDAAVEAALTLNLSTAYDVVVGTGGTASSTAKNNGGDSKFHNITSLGGGGGGIGATTGTTAINQGEDGGCGGGAAGSSSEPTGDGTAGQGYDGAPITTTQDACGGGGAGAQPSNWNGGAGQASSITGSSVTYAGGGGAGLSTNTGTGGSGGGGAGGGASSGGTNGTDGLGGGGGGAGRGTSGTYTSVGSDGGDGVVIIRIPNTHSATFSGVTSSLSHTPGSDRVYTVTAGSGTVTFSLD